MVEIVADVLTVKHSDSRPAVEMSIEDINSASDQPESDTQFSAYTAEEFDTAERIEFHMDFENPDGEDVRVVDGRAATWDATAETVSVDLQRSDTARTGQYYFEWVLIYDSNVTDLDNATEVNTVPDVGYYGLTVKNPTGRSLVAADEPDRSVGHLWLGEQTDTPTDSEIGSGNVAFYAKNDGLLYTRPHGGTESLVRPTDDTVYMAPGDTLQTKLNEAAGGRLVILPGTHSVTNDNAVASGTEIIGIGYPTLETSDGPKGMFYIEDESDITIRGLNLDGLGQAIRSIEIVTTADPGCDNIIIEDNYIHDFQPDSSDTIWGFRIGDTAGWPPRNSNFRIANNRFETFGEQDWDNILFGFMENFEIVGNTFKDINRNVFLYYSRNGVMSGNTFDMPNAQYSLHVIAEDTTVSDNTFKLGSAQLRIHNNGEHSYDPTGVVADSNVFRDVGIIIDDGQAGEPIRDVTVSNNYIADTSTHQSRGIYTQSNGGLIERLHIIGNTIRGSHWDGISLQDASHCFIGGNVVFNNNQNGGSVPGGLAVTDSDHVSLVGNMLFDNQSTPTQTDGLDINGSADCYISGNFTYGNTGLGLRERNSASANLIRDNHFSEGATFLSEYHLWNHGADDAVATVPASPGAGDVYLDDGTNTGDSSPHLRYHDGAAWNDL